ncbi:MAG: leucine--tRNA ligase [Candidatus Micrarchaeota archaeon]|nr:leucine--tRNA ligase [Candidatus Micrarchaeota archaeon]
MEAYERKWQQKWEEAGLFEPEPDKRKKFFITFPYPYQNGPPHIGHGFTFLRNEVFARYKRMRGFNVLLPQAWHATGGPIVASALKIREGDEKQIKTLKSLGIPEDEIKKFSDPEYWIKYFTSKWKKAFKSLGASVDWRREFFTTHLNPAYSKFIEWQYRKLRDLGYLVKGSHPVVWCPKEKKVVGDHDRPDEYAGIVPEEVVLIKFSRGKIIFPCVTFRPETVYGVTNIWINPDSEYCEIEIGEEKWIVSAASIPELEAQKGKVKIVKKFAGKDIEGLEVKNPVTGSVVPVLTAEFVKPEFGTGVVMSVPAHAPYDYIALKESGLEFKMISLIQVEGYGEFPAAEVCERMGIKSQKEVEKLEKATKEVYTAEFHKGILKDITGKKGMKVSDAKPVLVEEFVKSGAAEKYYVLPSEVLCRCGERCIAGIIKDQWFLKYSDPEWKRLAHECIDGMSFFPEEIRRNLHSAVDWLRDWACTHKGELGTPLPFDREWVVESLSDSTIYPAYYIVAKYLQNPERYGINIERLKDSFFDFVFLGEGDPAEVSAENGIEKELLEEIRKEFVYWYPVDFRNSAKDLLNNHLPFFIFHHVALFPESFWPKAIGVNGWMMVGGEKMSKSKGNFILLEEAVEKWGADVTRLSILFSGSMGLDDMNFEPEFPERMKRKIKQLFRLVELYGSGRDEIRPVDRWFRSRLHRRIKTVTEFMENTSFRDAMERILFESFNDLSWYTRRCREANREVMKEFIESLVLMLSPFAPHAAEELWEKLGKSGFVSIENWPEAKEEFIDDVVEKQEELVVKTLEDIRELKKIVKGEWKEIRIYTSRSWKYRVLEIASEKPENLVKEIMKIDEIKKHGTEAVKFAQKLTDRIEKPLSMEAEFQALKSAEGFFERELGCQVRVLKGDESDSEKAMRAEPGKPGIEIITE